jgi:hypothetical protein
MRVYVQFSNLLLCWTYDHDFYGTSHLLGRAYS